MLELNHITFNADDGTPIVSEINLKLNDSTIYAITGPNGSGKSSLARIIMGITKPSSGSILFDGRDITALDITQRAQIGIGYAFQNPPDFKGITVREMLTLASPDTPDKGQICDMLYNVGLCSQEYLDREMDSSLSGGERKRIEIATVLARKLKLAVFDEPEAGIDLWSFQQLAETFRNIHNTTDTTLVIISHQERILELADEILVMTEGRIDRSIGRDELLKSNALDELCNCRMNCGIRGDEDVRCIG